MFSKNSYPETIFDNCVNKVLNKKFEKANKPSELEKDKDKVILCIPYFGLASSFAKKMKRLFKVYYNIDLQCVYRSFKVKNYFSLKCATPIILQSNVVYRFECPCDTDLSYIGKTKRHLSVRIKEHISGNPSQSAIHHHVQNCITCSSHNLNNCFKIIDTGSNDSITKIKESFYIKRHRPKLNGQLSGKGTSFLLNVF